MAPEGELLYNAGFHSDHQYKGSPPFNYPGKINKTDAHVKHFFGLCGIEIGKADEKGGANGVVKSCGFATKKNPVEGFKPPPSIPGKNDYTAYDDQKGSAFKVAAIADLKNRRPENPGSTEGKDIWTIKPIPANKT